MPSRVEETKQASEMAYRAINSSKEMDLCMKWMGINSIVPGKMIKRH